MKLFFCTGKVPFATPVNIAINMTLLSSTGLHWKSSLCSHCLILQLKCWARFVMSDRLLSDDFVIRACVCGFVPDFGLVEWF